MPKHWNYRKMTFTIILLLLALFTFVTCSIYHAPVSGSIINHTSNPVTSLQWKGSIDCSGRKLLDINPWHDAGLKTCGVKEFSATIHADGSFTFPSARFFSALRQKDIHYRCTLVTPENKTVGIISSPFGEKLTLHLYTQPVLIMADADHNIRPQNIPENITLRIVIQDLYTGESTATIPLQKFLDNHCIFNFTDERIVELYKQRSEGTVSITLNDSFKKLKPIAIRNGEHEVWRHSYMPGDVVRIPVSYERLLATLKQWPDKIENGDAIYFDQREQCRQHPPSYFIQLKKSIRGIGAP